ncbi:hypothetical protein GCK72_016131 [Caenorhabditis remanei]|uniref:Uncharacterized protein n=1 Tax=Caenorhabditis remanei TaxID=31234 RepID=A0A6A5GYR1_CAERE|nr:hypothetical protein GCK72_016131 [Caenorhabditis remanei]KAF1759664.1 hypothetical protein GCK72_016131 [Caenorhabditis remanei]
MTTTPSSRNYSSIPPLESIESHQPRHNEDVLDTTMVVTNGTATTPSDIESSRSWTESATSPTGLTDALESLKIQDEREDENESDESNTDFQDDVDYGDSDGEGDETAETTDDDSDDNKTSHAGYPKKWYQKNDKDAMEIVHKLKFAKKERKSKTIGNLVEFNNVWYEYREFRTIAGKSYDTEFCFDKWPQMKSYTVQAIGHVKQIFWMLVIDKSCEERSYVIKMPKKDSFEHFLGN